MTLTVGGESTSRFGQFNAAGMGATSRGLEFRDAAVACRAAVADASAEQLAAWLAGRRDKTA